MTDLISPAIALQTKLGVQFNPFERVEGAFSRRGRLVDSEYLLCGTGNAASCKRGNNRLLTSSSWRSLPIGSSSCSQQTGCDVITRTSALSVGSTRVVTAHAQTCNDDDRACAGTCSSDRKWSTASTTSHAERRCRSERLKRLQSRVGLNFHDCLSFLLFHVFLLFPVKRRSLAVSGRRVTTVT